MLVAAGLPVEDHSECAWLNRGLVLEVGEKPAEKTAQREPVYFELSCDGKESAELVHEILLDKHFRAGRKGEKIQLVMQNGYEGLEQARSYLRGFGLKLCRQHGKNVWNVREFA